MPAFSVSTPRGYIIEFVQLNRTGMLLIEIRQDTCDFCGCCVGVCPEDAIELKESRIEIVEERCTNCAKCVWVCPFEALLFNKPVSAKEPA